MQVKVILIKSNLKLQIFKRGQRIKFLWICNCIRKEIYFFLSWSDLIKKSLNCYEQKKTVVSTLFNKKKPNKINYPFTSSNNTLKKYTPKEQRDNVHSTLGSVLTLPTFHAVRLHIHYFSNNTTVKGKSDFMAEGTGFKIAGTTSTTHPISFARINQNTNSTLT